MRKIAHAAIKTDQGVVIVGKRHHNCIAIMVECGYPTPVKGTQGFVDSSGCFVDRADALIIARDAGQLEGRKKHGPSNILFSEDLY